LLNHWPIIGTFIGLALFLLGLWTRNYDLKQASLVIFAVLAVLTIPVYLSGNAAADALKKQHGWPTKLVDSHEGAAVLAFLALELTGIFSLVTLWPSARSAKPEAQSKSWATMAVLISSLATAGIMIVVGNTGGNIRHPEIFTEGEAPSSIAAIGASFILAVRYFVIDYSRWVWPFVEDLHFIGLIMLLGTVGILSVRTLGFLKQLPIGPLHKLIPVGLVGLLINVITGFMFFIGMPFFYTGNAYFQLKIFAILLAGSILVMFYCTGMFRKWGSVGAGEDAPTYAKLVAAASLLLWVAIVIIGRYIPLGEST
jgi:hypothetical protein